LLSATSAKFQGPPFGLMFRDCWVGLFSRGSRPIGEGGGGGGARVGAPASIESGGRNPLIWRGFSLEGDRTAGPTRPHHYTTFRTFGGAGAKRTASWKVPVFNWRRRAHRPLTFAFGMCLRSTPLRGPLHGGHRCLPIGCRKHRALCTAPSSGRRALGPAIPPNQGSE